MKCPVCGDVELKAVRLEEGPDAAECPRCKGHWISSDNYFKWMQERGQGLCESHASFTPDPGWDSKKALICPDCGRILVKYRLGQDIKFRLDHCGGCSGVWFDRAEWETLKGRCLHDTFREFFTDAHQKKKQRDEARARNEKIFREKFGPDFDRIVEMKKFIETHPLRSIIMAFLEEKDPLA